MSFSIMRIEKIKAQGCVGMEIHNLREKTGISHSNPDIDWERTKENEVLVRPEGSLKKACMDKINALNLPRKIRSDATVMVEFLVTSDNAFFETMSRDQQREFFQKSLGFINERYGNVVCATIHNDERTPHLHVDLVPITQDGRLSAKSFFAPVQLRKLQDDFNRFINEQGYALERGEIGSRNEHLTSQEYKTKMRREELAKQKSELEKLEKLDQEVTLSAEKGKITYSTKEVDAIKEQNKALKLSVTQTRDLLKESEYKCSTLKDELESKNRALDSKDKELIERDDLKDRLTYLDEYRKANKSADNELKTFDQEMKNAEVVGVNKKNCLDNYRKALENRDKAIKHSQGEKETCTKIATTIEQLRTADFQLGQMRMDMRTLQKECAEEKGLFHRKQRVLKQSEIDKKQKEIDKMIEHIKDLGASADKVPEKLCELESEKENHEKLYEYSVEKTNEYEKTIDRWKLSYKSWSAVQSVLPTTLQKIAQRQADTLKATLEENRAFYIKKEDRESIMDKMRENKIPEPMIRTWQHNNITLDLKRLEEERETRHQSIDRENKHERVINRTESRGIEK